MINIKQLTTQLVQQIMNTFDSKCIERDVFLQLLKGLSLKEMYEIANEMKHRHDLVEKYPLSGYQ